MEVAEGKSIPHAVETDALIVRLSHFVRSPAFRRKFGLPKRTNSSLFPAEAGTIPHAVEIVVFMVSRGRQPSDPSSKESEG